MRGMVHGRKLQATAVNRCYKHSQMHVLATLLSISWYLMHQLSWSRSWLRIRYIFVKSFGNHYSHGRPILAWQIGIKVTWNTTIYMFLRYLCSFQQLIPEYKKGGGVKVIGPRDADPGSSPVMLLTKRDLTIVIVSQSYLQ